MHIKTLLIKMFDAKEWFGVIILVMIIMTSQKTFRLRKDKELIYFVPLDLVVKLTFCKMTTTLKPSGNKRSQLIYTRKKK